MEDHKRIHAMYHVLGSVAIVGIVLAIGAMAYVVITAELCTEGSYTCTQDAAIYEE